MFLLFLELAIMLKVHLNRQMVIHYSPANGGCLHPQKVTLDLSWCTTG